MTGYWIGVAGSDHVRAAVRGGFCQLGHGKEAPLRRLRPGDRLVYYSPRERSDGGDSVKAFTAAGEILEGAPYQVRVSASFCPFRRDLRYFDGHDAEIRALLPHLSFARGRTSWGLVMRRGTFRVEREDYLLIAKAMGCSHE